MLVSGGDRSLSIIIIRDSLAGVIDAVTVQVYGYSKVSRYLCTLVQSLSLVGSPGGRLLRLGGQNLPIVKVPSRIYSFVTPSSIREQDQPKSEFEKPTMVIHSISL